MREKLIEILETVVSSKEVLCDGEVLVSTARVADHLIANGVTFREHDCHWATEQAYKNGYAKGYEDGKRDAVKPRGCPHCDDGRSFIGALLILGNDGKWHEINYCPNCGKDLRGEEDG